MFQPIPWNNLSGLDICNIIPNIATLFNKPTCQNMFSITVNDQFHNTQYRCCQVCKMNCESIQNSNYSAHFIKSLMFRFNTSLSNSVLINSWVYNIMYGICLFNDNRYTIVSGLGITWIGERSVNIYWLSL